MLAGYETPIYLQSQSLGPNPTNTQLSRKARSLTFLLPRSLKSFRVSSFILKHRRKRGEL